MSRHYDSIEALLWGEGFSGVEGADTDVRDGGSGLSEATDVHARDTGGSTSGGGSGSGTIIPGGFGGGQYGGSGNGGSGNGGGGDAGNGDVTETVTEETVVEESPSGEPVDESGYPSLPSGGGGAGVPPSRKKSGAPKKIGKPKDDTIFGMNKWVFYGLVGVVGYLAYRRLK
mgnify:CR=1 FL=1